MAIFYSDSASIDTLEISSSLLLNGKGTFIGTQIISGSLDVTNGITGSLLGTASFASFVPNTFTQGGNSFGTTSTIGTNDNQDLYLITNGDTSMIISSSTDVLIIGKTIIGTTAVTPTSQLQVRGIGATLSTTALKVENSNASASLTVLDNGQIQLNNYTDPFTFPGTPSATLAVDSSGNIITISGGGSTTPGGSNTQIQYNSGSTFRGVPTLTFDGTTLRATGSFTGSFTGSLFGTASFALNGGVTTNPITFNDSGSGDAPGTSFNGSTSRTVSYNTLGANKVITSGTAAPSGGVDGDIYLQYT